MKPERKQRLLAFVADDEGRYYYDGPIDGRWGPKSREAEERFLRDFRGMDEEKQNSDGWKEIRFFRREEFRCRCGKYCNGFPREPDMKMVGIADTIRQKLGVPLHVNSGLRCGQHNSNVGGVKNSQHMLGTACDLAAPAGITPEQMAAAAEEILDGTGGIGIYSWGIHVDIRSAKARWKG